MIYHLIVYRYPDVQDIHDVLIDREFRFSESSHKVIDVIHAVMDQLEAEGGPGPDATPEAGEAIDLAEEIDPDKLDMLADWFDIDDLAKGRSGRTEVQADLRRWAKLARDAARTPERPDKCNCRAAYSWGATGVMPPGHYWHWNTPKQDSGYLAHQAGYQP